MINKKCLNALLDDNLKDEVIISQGKQESYDNILKKDNKTIYFTNDEGRIFLGDTEYTRPVLHGHNLPIKKVASQSLFYNEVEERLYLTLDGVSWKSISSKQSDWQQDDKTASDYIKNKPIVDIHYDANSTNAQSGKAVASALTKKVDKLENGNLLVGENNTLNAKGYKMLSITKSNPSESDPTQYLQLDIEVNDKDLEEKAASSYAVSDLVVIVTITHWVDAYAIYSLSTNDAGNSIISVRPYSVIGNKFTDTAVDNITMNPDMSDTENWIYVDGKSFGTPVLRTRGSTLTGEQNTLIGRHAFGSGSLNKILDDSSAVFGDENSVGYRSLSNGRRNKIYNGVGFGNDNIIEGGSNVPSFITGRFNNISRFASGNLVSGHQNALNSGNYNTVLGGNNGAKANGSYNLLSGKYNSIQDGNYSGAIGTSNKIHSGGCNFAVGHDNHLRGNNNLCVGTYNSLLDTASNNILVGQSLSGKYPYQAIFGKLNQDDANAVAIFAYPDDAKPNNRRNVATVDKNGNIKTLGDVTSNGVNITQQSNSLTNWMYALMRNIGESATITTVSRSNIRIGHTIVDDTEYISVTGGQGAKAGYISVFPGDVIFIQSLKALSGTTWNPPSVGWYLTDSCDGLTTSGVTSIKIIQKDESSYDPGWVTYSNIAIVVPEGANYLLFDYNASTTPQIKIIRTTLGDNIVKKTDIVTIDTGSAEPTINIGDDNDE